MNGFRMLAALLVAAIVCVTCADDASAQLLRRGRGNCNTGGCNVGSGGCNVGGSQGCNISQSATPTRATAEDLLEQVTATKARESAPVLPAKQSPLVLNESAALAFCAPVTRSKHQLDLEKVVYRPASTPPVDTVAKSVTARPPIRAVASR